MKSVVIKQNGKKMIHIKKTEKGWETDFNIKFTRKNPEGKYQDKWFLQDGIEAREMKEFIRKILKDYIKKIKC